MEKRISKLAFLLIAFSISVMHTVFSQIDAPLRPEKWIEKMGTGSWMIFNIPPDKFGFADAKYSEVLVDSIVAAGFTGGRLHWQARDLVDEQSNLINPEAVKFLSAIIDDLTARNMAICLQYDCLKKEESKAMTRQTWAKYLSTWEQLCIAFKDKSHLLAMCPVIEFHGFEYLRKKAIKTKDISYKQALVDSTNVFYTKCTEIFRRHNPTRIMSYKPWGSAKTLPFHELDFPYANDPADPSEGYYVASGSGAYGMGEWELYSAADAVKKDELVFQMLTAGKGKEELGIAYAVKWREQTGIQFWIDHWEPDYWKNGDWTVEQNLAYVESLLDTLRELRIASSGLQIRRMWDSDKENWKDEAFVSELLPIIKKYSWRNELTEHVRE
ncbi:MULTISPECIES: hypothetical protein [Carboxylicivirga]|uniref:hypothetical protein n=1 Tax=Carboxylicivirga TaxID=1628153 RepID=UPI0011775346|nr:hypothetical protein [Carboxylicivirga sp. M1479]TRX66096.1 hypothetical protein FNN09_15490 [Carboxylicivirga sp. M1479]